MTNPSDTANHRKSLLAVSVIVFALHFGMSSNLTITALGGISLKPDHAWAFSLILLIYFGAMGMLTEQNLRFTYDGELTDKGFSFAVRDFMVQCFALWVGVVAIVVCIINLIS